MWRKKIIKKKIKLNDNIRLIETGYISSEQNLSIIYNAADVTAVPYNKEAFG